MWLGCMSLAFPVVPWLPEKAHSLVLFLYLCWKQKHSGQRGEDLLKAPHFSTKTHSKPLGSCRLQKCRVLPRNLSPSGAATRNRRCMDQASPCVARAQAQTGSSEPVFFCNALLHQARPKRSDLSLVTSRAYISFWPF